MELIYLTPPKQSGKSFGRPDITSTRSCRLSGFNDLRLGMAVSNLLPRPFCITSILGEAICFIIKYEAIRLRIRERESIIALSPLGPDANLGPNSLAGLIAAEKLIAGAAVALNEVIQAIIVDCCGQHLDEAKEIGFSRTVGTDQHCGAGQVVDFEIGESSKTLDVERLNSVRHNLSPLSSSGSPVRAICFPCNVNSAAY